MKLKYVFVAAGLIMAIASCKKDDKLVTPDNPNKTNYAISVTGGTFPNQTTYLFGTNKFPSGSVSASNAAEFAASGIMYKYGSNVYISTFGAPATLRKYEFDADGKPKLLNSITVPGLKTFGGILFISNTEAYASSNGVGGIPKVIKFNPDAMSITGNIDLTDLQKPGAADVFYLGMVERDGNLFMGINYLNASFGPLGDSVYVAVINRASGTVTKLLADGRSNEMWYGGTENSFSPNAMVKDAAGNIYVMGFADRGKPSGVLRINAGTTVFDPSYFFNLSSVTGGPCLGLFYFGDNNVFTVRYSDSNFYPFDADNSTFAEGAKADYYKINLTAKTTSGNIAPSLPKLFGGSAFMTKWDDTKVYFNAPSNGSSSIYSYTLSNGSVSKEFDLTGACNGFTKL